jgi:alcohol/geraniol dehydrogenase (NADP+)
MKVVSYAAHVPRGRLEPLEYDAGPLGPDEVCVAVTHCGICHTDAAMIDNEFDISKYPVVAGHEAVGVVAAIGASVDSTRLRVGQRVGIGAISGACMNCEQCLTGKHNLCPKRDDTVLRGGRGAFASHVRASNWHFAYPIPDEIASEDAGPLLCAGITVFTPLLRHGVQPTDRVAVVGIGGLGHLALQFMSKWGCDVTAISSSSDKEEQAREFGARHFINAKDPSKLKSVANSFDFVMSTVSGDLPWDDYVATLKPQGKLCILGGAKRPISVSMMNLLPHEKVIAGGIPGSPVETTQMLAFAARHGIKPLVETFPMSQINQALEHVRQGKPRFRAVLVASNS